VAAGRLDPYLVLFPGVAGLALAWAGPAIVYDLRSRQALGVWLTVLWFAAVAVTVLTLGTVNIMRRGPSHMVISKAD
jgi:hypothetical protein